MSPTRIDPTRTTTLRARFAAEITRRFKRLNQLIYQLLVVEDALGLRSKNQVTVVSTQTLATLNEKKEFSSTQVNLPQSIGKVVLALGQQIAPDDLAGKGLEDEPHITVRFGLHADSAEEVRGLLEGQPPIEATLGGVGFFPGEKFDVLFVAVFSKDLRRINRVLANLPHTVTQAAYKPHATIAYVQKGLGSHYAALLNQAPFIDGLLGRITFHSVLFSDKERNKVAIPLLGPQLSLNTRWRFLTDEQQLDAFVAWLQVTVAKEIIADTTDKWLEKYIQAAYVKGMNQAFVDVKKPALWTGISPTESKLDFFEGSRSEFLRQSFGRPVSVNRVKLLASRSFNDLRGITDKMSAEISRNLVDGMIQGLSPRDVARTMSETVTKLGRNRALIISRTETIRAHNEGALDALEELGVEEVGVMVEWSTAKDGRVCEECAPLQGIVLKTKEAHGILPRHPNCRCAIIPANVGEKTAGQKRGRARITKAIEASVRAEAPKKDKRQGIATLKRKSRWAGATKEIDKKRPRKQL